MVKSVQADWWLGLLCVGGPVFVLLLVVLWIYLFEREEP
jgi:hypothetical protein